jgi:hypothetical protein
VIQLIRQGLPPELVQMVRLLPLLLFLGTGFVVARTPDGGSRRRWINRLLVVFLVLHAGVTLLQVDAWPFSPYRMMAVDVRDRDTVRNAIAFRAVDASGREWTVDPLAWSPHFPQAVMGWFEVALPRASPENREAVLSFLYKRAEDARRQRLAGRRVGNERWLGPLTAPDTNLSRPLGGVPSEPFTALRVYRLYWKPAEFAADRSRVQRRLLLEYRAP